MRWKGVTRFLKSARRASVAGNSFIHHEAARDGELAQGAGNEFLRPVQITPRRQLEIPQRAEIVLERRQQAGEADRRMRAVVERQ
jgi:hypothetical protein